LGGIGIGGGFCVLFYFEEGVGEIGVIVMKKQKHPYFSSLKTSIVSNSSSSSFGASGSLLSLVILFLFEELAFFASK
jgi:hypothetical protein